MRVVLALRREVIDGEQACGYASNAPDTSLNATAIFFRLLTFFEVSASLLEPYAVCISSKG